MRGRAGHTGGFTLLELLIALVILTIIAAIVYASFSSVINSVDTTRVDAEELRLRQFLIRSFTTNLASVYSDSLYEQQVFALIGEDAGGAGGAEDSLRFVSSSPLLGGLALPGDLKEVTYDVIPNKDGETATGADAPAMLQAVETPLLGANVQEIDDDLGRFVADENYEAPSWSVPIRSMNIRYFDGEEWYDDWDSLELTRMPWCIEVSINFARPPEQLEVERDEGINPDDSPDLVLVVPIPTGVGTNQDTRLQSGPNALEGQNPNVPPAPTS